MPDAILIAISAGFGGALTLCLILLIRPAGKDTDDQRALVRDNARLWQRIERLRGHLSTISRAPTLHRAQAKALAALKEDKST